MAKRDKSEPEDAGQSFDPGAGQASPQATAVEGPPERAKDVPPESTFKEMARDQASHPPPRPTTEAERAQLRASHRQETIDRQRQEAEEALRKIEQEKQTLATQRDALQKEVAELRANSLQAKEAALADHNARLLALEEQQRRMERHAANDEPARRLEALRKASTHELENALGELHKEPLSYCTAEELEGELARRKNVSNR